MKDFKLALLYFCLAYLIGSIVGFITFSIHVSVMWIVMFAIMPIVFGYFFYRYLRKTECKISESVKEINLLIVVWILASFLVDAIVYIIIVPIIYGYKSNWTFFADQSPWIWLNYATIIFFGHISRLIYNKRLERYVS